MIATANQRKTEFTSMTNTLDLPHITSFVQAGEITVFNECVPNVRMRARLTSVDRYEKTVTPENVNVRLNCRFDTLEFGK